NRPFVHYNLSKGHAKKKPDSNCRAFWEIHELVISRVLNQIWIRADLSMRNRINFPIRIAGRFMIPPCTVDILTETNKIRSALSFKNKFTTTLCQQLIHG